MLCFALTCLQCEAVIGRWNWPPIFASSEVEITFLAKRCCCLFETHMHLRIRGDVLPFHVIIDVIGAAALPSCSRSLRAKQTLGSMKSNQLR
jgi:hypothetical protein